MQIEIREVELTSGGSAMRVRISSPRASGAHPGVLLYSEIFQLTGPICRSADRLAGHGFVVAAPEIFHGVEPRGAVIAYDDAGRARGLADAARTSAAQHDADRRAVLDWFAGEAHVARGACGALGFCIGGHLALRAALDPRISAVVACYPTGVHDGKLGSDADAGTLAALAATRASLHVVFGARDPHVPPDGRAKIAAALRPLGPRLRVREFDAEHAFMRDEGARYDAAASDATWNELVPFLRSALSRDAI
jgi:carboxymethylenebutenolidase